MPTPDLLRPGVPRQRLARLVSIPVIALALLAGMWAASLPLAKADFNRAAGFQCGKLDPAWTGNYRCDSPDNISGYNRQWVFINTYERAGCVDYADVWHNLITNWVCYPKGTELGSVKVRQDGGWYRGVIRNNNLSSAGNFNGIVTWNE